MQDSNGVNYRINRAFLLQGLLIAVATIFGVYLAKIVIEEILIKNAIQEEQAYFWQNYENNPKFPLPDTKNLSGFFDRSRLPENIRNKTPDRLGYYEFGEDENRVVLQVSSQDQQKLYLLYNRGQVDSLVLYYGLVPLLVALLVLYISIWLIYRYSRRMVSPFIKLARQINQLDLSQPDFSTLRPVAAEFDTDNEVQILTDATISLGERLLAYIGRERDFTRDASHELRSPLTVINIASDMLISEQDLPEAAEKSVIKIQRAAHDIEKLIEVFLLLAREDDQALTTDKVSINRVVEKELQRSQSLINGKDINIQVNAQHGLYLWGSEAVVSALIGNLIRNAILYTDEGGIDILITGHSLEIRDTGSGIAGEDLESMFDLFQRGSNSNASGYGIGLSIVKRLSDRFNWPVEVHSRAGEGTRFKVGFPDSEIIARSYEADVAV